MLSMPGATEGLINIFEVDADTLQYDQTAFAADIAQYGLFVYADFEELLPEIIFDAFQVQYITVALGKGIITWEQIETLIAHYAKFWV
jgi:predicted RNA methylase